MVKEMSSKNRNVCCCASMTIYCLISFVLLTNVMHTEGFAFEKQPSAKFQPPATVEELEFGFTLAYEQETFLVGSPRSSVNSEGALYSCPLAMLSSGSRVCSKINIAGSDASGTTQDVCSYDADWQRLGSSLAVSGKKILTCAPTWNNTCTKVYGDKYSTIVGKCFYSTNGVQGPFSSIVPVYDWKTGTLPMYHIKDGRCQVGFGSHFLQASNEMVLGAPGCTSWIGDVFQGPLSPEGPYVRRGNSSYTAGLLDPSSENPNAYDIPHLEELCPNYDALLESSSMELSIEELSIYALLESSSSGTLSKL
ncbi:integrin alpha-6-like [Hyalella azteca]|uniref:Integrin alpha-6-like n=1 Tax=Hyalella azteca TaxID=294128 RepID=A0A8B7P3Q1_HYAAZ|nr:integrin alpha-6-like [Hyalella azteca]